VADNAVFPNMTPTFWGEVAPTDHFAQFYETDSELIHSVANFICEGLKAKESAIVIATPQHLRGIENRLLELDVDVATAILEDRFVAMDADRALATFMAHDWPDEKLFCEFVERLIQRASAHSRRVRAFGEMVALLWRRGQLAATVSLEHLWNRMCAKRNFPLFCAYPKSGFTKEPCESFAEICAAHSRLV